MKNRLKKNLLIIVLLLFLLIVISLIIYRLIIGNSNGTKKDDNTPKEESSPFILNGTWIADGTQNRAVIGMNEDGTYIYADDYSVPYDLIIYEDGTYYANFHNRLNEEKGTYSIKKDDLSFYPNNYPDRMMWHCKIKSDKEIFNCTYAASYTRVD